MITTPHVLARRLHSRVTVVIVSAVLLISTAIAASLVIPTTDQTIAGGSDGGFEVNPRPHSDVVDWIEAMLMAIEQNPPSPTATTWRMWVVTSSMYEAHAAFDRQAIGTVTGRDLRQPARLRTITNRTSAVNHAAHRALTFTFPDQAAIFDSVLELHDDPDDADGRPRSPRRIGEMAANRVIAHRLVDGSNAQNGFAETTSAIYPTPYEPHDVDTMTDPNRWVPLRVPTGARLDAHDNPVVDPDDPGSYRDQRFLTPHWGAVEPFALTAGDQFRPSPPPQLGSGEPYVDAPGVATTNDEAYRAQAAELLGISGNLDDVGRVSAEFWADGPHTWTPPGHWMQLAIGVSLRDHHSLDEDVRMFMALSGGLLDAGIAAWDAKRAFDYVRPASAIPHLYRGMQVTAWAGPNRGVRKIDGADWQPYQSPTFVTPPFAEYVSGHSTFSRTAAEILAAFTGSAQMYDGVTRLGRDHDGDGVEDLLGRHVATPGSLVIEDGPSDTVALQWSTFFDAADEAGYSRRHGGIHFQDGDLRARAMGSQIGLQAYDRAELLWNPFHVLIEETLEAAERDQLPTTAVRRLVVEFTLARATFASDADLLGCRHLRRAQEHLGRDDAEGSTIVALRHRVQTVYEAMCR